MSSNLTFKSRLNMFKSKSATKGGEGSARPPWTRSNKRDNFFPTLLYIILEFNYIIIELNENQHA